MLDLINQTRDLRSELLEKDQNISLLTGDLKDISVCVTLTQTHYCVTLTQTHYCVTLTQTHFCPLCWNSPVELITHDLSHEHNQMRWDIHEGLHWVWHTPIPGSWTC